MKQPLERPQVITLAALFIVIVVLAVAFFLGGREEVIKPGSQAVLPATPAAPQGPVAKKKIVLFFASDDDDRLHPEEREIEAVSTPAEEAGRVLQELIKGSRGGFLTTIPAETRLRQVYFTKEGVAYADFSKELSANHPSGSAAEIATVYAVVNSLAYNFKDVKRVFILIDGAEKDTLNGHVSLNRPLLPDFSLVAQ
jgi:spore germination protein GerM